MPRWVSRGPELDREPNASHNSFLRVDSKFDLRFVIWLADKKSNFSQFDLVSSVARLSAWEQFWKNREHRKARNRYKNAIKHLISVFS